MDVPLIVLVVMFLVAPGMAKARHDRLNKEQGVLAHWEGLRITRTELIEGYKKDAPRYPIAGMAARLDDSGGRVSVTIERPLVPARIVKSRPFGRNFFYVSRHVTDDAAKFVQAFNIASSQAAMWFQR